jgi:hypothetical protein
VSQCLLCPLDFRSGIVRARGELWRRGHSSLNRSSASGSFRKSKGLRFRGRSDARGHARARPSWAQGEGIRSES